MELFLKLSPAVIWEAEAERRENVEQGAAPHPVDTSQSESGG
jgi:hypothetical protein